MVPASLRVSLPESATAAGGTSLDAQPALLIVDDDVQMLGTLVCYFERRGFHTAPAATVEEAKILFARRNTWTLVISDFHLPDGTGADLCDWVQAQRGTPPPFLLMSGSVNGEVETTGMQYLAKPFAVEQLEARVGALLGRK